MKYTKTVEIDVPDGATHIYGDPLDDNYGHMYYKCVQIGAAGDHWFVWSGDKKIWTMVSHHKPHWIITLAEAGLNL